MKRYTTISTDYTGCDETIRLVLKDDKAILCECWNNKNCSSKEKGECLIIAYDKSSVRPYVARGDCSFRYADPIMKTRKAKKFSDIAKWLDNCCYVCNGKGEWEPTKNTTSDKLHKPTYPSYLFAYCGREIPDGVFFPEEWLE